MRSCKWKGTASALAIALSAGCAASRPGVAATPAGLVPKDDPRAFQEFVLAMDNTLVEVNQLERMGGGIRDRMILVDANSLVRGDQGLVLYDALNRNYGKIRSLRSSMETNEGVREVMTRAGKRIDELLAIDARQQGVVILYYKDD
ncbi:MAG: hypothetical protein ABI613_07780 [Gemmatimonadota bacterium]